VIGVGKISARTFLRTYSPFRVIHQKQWAVRPRSLKLEDMQRFVDALRCVSICAWQLSFGRRSPGAGGRRDGRGFGRNHSVNSLTGDARVARTLRAFVLGGMVFREECAEELARSL
jgi:hypothetical protein